MLPEKIRSCAGLKSRSLLQLKSFADDLAQAVQENMAKKGGRGKPKKVRAPQRDPALPPRRSTRPAALSASQRISNRPVESPEGKFRGDIDEAYEPDSDVTGRLYLHVVMSLA